MCEIGAEVVIWSCPDLPRPARRTNPCQQRFFFFSTTSDEPHHYVVVVAGVLVAGGVAVGGPRPYTSRSAAKKPGARIPGARRTGAAPSGPSAACSCSSVPHAAPTGSASPPQLRKSWAGGERAGLMAGRPFKTSSSNTGMSTSLAPAAARGPGSA